jgi:very-short-patch-repair endonuclease
VARQTTVATVAKARKLRRQMTLPEVLLWRILRQSPHGLKFRRQHPAGPYVLDFYCPSAKLGVEIDGIAHDMGNRPRYDERRDAFLQERGVEVVRLPAVEVLKSIDKAADAIVAHCRSRIGAPPPR